MVTLFHLRENCVSLFVSQWIIACKSSIKSHEAAVSQDWSDIPVTIPFCVTTAGVGTGKPITMQGVIREMHELLSLPPTTGLLGKNLPLTKGCKVFEYSNGKIKISCLLVIINANINKYICWPVHENRRNFCVTYPRTLTKTNACSNVHSTNYTSLGHWIVTQTYHYLSYLFVQSYWIQPPTHSFTNLSLSRNLHNLVRSSCHRNMEDTV